MVLVMVVLWWWWRSVVEIVWFLVLIIKCVWCCEGDELKKFLMEFSCLLVDVLWGWVERWTERVRLWGSREKYVNPSNRKNKYINSKKYGDVNGISRGNKGRILLSTNLSYFLFHFLFFGFDICYLKKNKIKIYHFP